MTRHATPYGAFHIEPVPASRKSPSATVFS